MPEQRASVPISIRGRCRFIHGPGGPPTAILGSCCCCADALPLPPPMRWRCNWFCPHSRRLRRSRSPPKQASRSAVATIPIGPRGRRRTIHAARASRIARGRRRARSARRAGLRGRSAPRHSCIRSRSPLLRPPRRSHANILRVRRRPADRQSGHQFGASLRRDQTSWSFR